MSSAESSPLVWGDIRVASGRIIQTKQTDRGRVVKSLHIDMLQSSSVELHHRPFYLALSLIFGAAAFWMHNIIPTDYDYYGVALSVVFLLVYFSTRRTTLTLSAGASDITAVVKGGKAGVPAALQFAAHIDAAALQSRIQQRPAHWPSTSPPPAASYASSSGTAPQTPSALPRR